MKSTMRTIRPSTRPSRTLRSLLAAGTLAAVLGVTLAAGCGGGGTTTGGTNNGGGQVVPNGVGRAQISVRWPDRGAPTRLIPFDANGIRVELRRGDGSVLASRLLARPSDPSPAPSGGGGGPTTTADFTDLPQGDYAVEAVAFPNADGSGVAQARAQGTLAIVPGQTATVRLALGSTIARVEILPRDIALTTAPTTLTAAAYNAADELVLTTRWQWSVTDGTVVALDPQGTRATVAATDVGETLVTLRETQTGREATKLFRVIPVPNPNPSGSGGVITRGDVAGRTWRVVSVKNGRQPAVTCPSGGVCTADETLDFGGEGDALAAQGTLFGGGGFAAGTYALQGNQLTLSVQIGDATVTRTYTALYDGTTLTLVRVLGDDGVEVIKLRRLILS